MAAEQSIEEQDARIREFIREIVAAMAPELDAQQVSGLFEEIEISREDGLRIGIRTNVPAVFMGRGDGRLNRLKLGLERITGMTPVHIGIARPGADLEKAKELREKGLLNCSFCGKSQKKVAKLIAGPGVYICNECINLCNEIIEEEGVLTTTTSDRGVTAKIEMRPVADLSTEDGLVELTRAASVITPVESHINDVVASLRTRGVTWAQIGAALGMTRQGAWSKFSGEE